MIEIVCDASVIVKWFHDADEQEVESSRALVAAHRDRRVLLATLDLAPYEVGNALLRGRAAASPQQVATIVGSLRDICQLIAPTGAELEQAAALAAEHGLTMYDAAYAAVAHGRGGQLATLDSDLLNAGLGRRPSELVAGL